MIFATRAGTYAERRVIFATRAGNYAERGAIFATRPGNSATHPGHFEERGAFFEMYRRAIDAGARPASGGRRDRAWVCLISRADWSTPMPKLVEAAERLLPRARVGRGAGSSLGVLETSEFVREVVARPSVRGG